MRSNMVCVCVCVCKGGVGDMAGPANAVPLSETERSVRAYKLACIHTIT